MSFVTEAEPYLYADCPPAVVESAAQRLVGQALTTFTEPATAAWRDLPYAYLACDLDRCLPIEVQDALAVGASHLEHVEASHSPMLSRPAAVEAFLRRAVASF